MMARQSDEFVVLGRLFEPDRLEGAKPILQILEKGAVQVGPHFTVFRVADNVQQAVADQGAFQQTGDEYKETVVFADGCHRLGAVYALEEDAWDTSFWHVVG